MNWFMSLHIFFVSQKILVSFSVVPPIPAPLAMPTVLKLSVSLATMTISLQKKSHVTSPVQQRIHRIAS
jgi:hypothetical protein